jgi:uncharacterized membrane protein YecN with MAPEG domain
MKALILFPLVLVTAYFAWFYVTRNVKKTAIRFVGMHLTAIAFIFMLVLGLFFLLYRSGSVSLI